MPYGFSGVMTGAAVVFFAYIGFDAVSTTAEEAKNPKRDLPIGIIASLVICTLLYLIVAAILSGIVPVVQFKSDAQFLNAPVGYALVGDQQGLGRGPRLGRRRRRHHERAARHAHEPAAHLLRDEPRPAAAGRRQQGPPEVPHALHHDHHHLRHRRRWSPAFVPIQILGEMTSIGTLFAFVVVSLAVIMLRVKRPEAVRPFRVPFGPRDPGARRAVVLYLMVSLSVMTWVRFLGWLDIGMVIYWFYGRTHSPLADRAEAARADRRARAWRTS